MPENIKRVGPYSKEEAAVGSSPSLDGTMDLLTEEEENIILAVIKRDEMERSIINAKIIEVRKEIQEIRQAGALTAGDDLSVICARCKFKFPPFLLPWADHGQRCVSCKFRVCAKCCRKEMNGSWLCILCSKYRQEKLLTGDWILRGGQLLQQQHTPSQPRDLFGSDLLRASLKEKNLSGSHNEAFRKHRSQTVTGDVKYTPAELMAISSDELASHETAALESTGPRSSWWKDTTKQGQKDGDSETQEVGGYDGDTSSLGSEPQPHVMGVTGGFDDCLVTSCNLDGEQTAPNTSSISVVTHSKIPSELPNRFRFGKTSSSLQENVDRNCTFNHGPGGENSHASKSMRGDAKLDRNSATAEEDVELTLKLNASKYTKIPISCTADQVAKKNKEQNLDRTDSSKRGQSEKKDSFDDIYNSSVSMFVQTMVPDAAAATVYHKSATDSPRRVLPERPGDGKNHRLCLQKSLSLSDEVAANTQFFQKCDFQQDQIGSQEKNTENELYVIEEQLLRPSVVKKKQSYLSSPPLSPPRSQKEYIKSGIPVKKTSTLFDVDRKAQKVSVGTSRRTLPKVPDSNMAKKQVESGEIQDHGSQNRAENAVRTMAVISLSRAGSNVSDAFSNTSSVLELHGQAENYGSEQGSDDTCHNTNIAGSFSDEDVSTCLVRPHKMMSANSANVQRSEHAGVTQEGTGKCEDLSLRSNMSSVAEDSNPEGYSHERDLSINSQISDLELDEWPVSGESTESQKGHKSAESGLKTQKNKHKGQADDHHYKSETEFLNNGKESRTRKVIAGDGCSDHWLPKAKVDLDPDSELGTSEQDNEGLLRHSGGRHVSDGGREPTGWTDHHLAVPVIAVTNAGVQGDIEDEEEEDNLDDMFSNHQPSQLLSSRSSLSSHSSLTDSRESLYSVYSDAGEVNYGHIGVTGEIQFNLSYNQRAKCLEVHVKQCKGLAPVDVKHSRSDPYVKTYLLPDKSRASKRKTRIKKHTLNPVFNEVLKYQISSSVMQSRSLWVTVWHNDRFGRNDFLGEVTIPLNYYDFNNSLPLWYPLQERVEGQDSMLIYKGDIFISLKYVTAEVVAASKNRSSTHKKNKDQDQPRGELHVLVKEAQNLTPMRGSAGSDPFCKGYLLPDMAHSSKQKTPVVRRSTNPQWQHILVFDGVDQSQLAEHGLELTVWDFERLSSNDFLGGVRLNLGQGTHLGRSVEWMDARGEEILAWKRMIEQPNQWVNVQLPLRAGMGKQNPKK